MQKAFSLLIEEGFITPIVGKGNKVNAQQQNDEKKSILNHMLSDIIKAGFDKEAILDALEKWED